MANYPIEPRMKPGDGFDYLPCDEADASHWAVIISPFTTEIFETRDEAEVRARRIEIEIPEIRAGRYNYRAGRFIWAEDDVEHH